MDYDAEDRRIGSENKNVQQTMSIYRYTAKRVCQFCLKEFSSGKALGGHMRIHIHNRRKQQQHPREEDHRQKSIADANCTDHAVLNKKKSNCVMCGKDFPSWKSLYGHMRCHPGRGWKGINPPAFFSSPASSFSLSADDYRHLASGEKNETVDLTASLKGWTVTAERGRKTRGVSSEFSGSAADVELLSAVHYLMRLSRGASVEEQGLGESIPDCQMDLSENTERKTDPSNHGEKRRKKKKVKLSDLNLASSVIISPLTPATAAGSKYRCDVCDKSFGSHQAYGGHRSRHNKIKIVIIDSNENRPFLSSSRSKPPPMETRHVCRRGLEFDLNEVPPVSGFDEPRLDFLAC